MRTSENTSKFCKTGQLSWLFNTSIRWTKYPVVVILRLSSHIPLSQYCIPYMAHLGTHPHPSSNRRQTTSRNDTMRSRIIIQTIQPCFFVKKCFMLQHATNITVTRLSGKMKAGRGCLTPLKPKHSCSPSPNPQAQSAFSRLLSQRYCSLQPHIRLLL